MPDITGLTVCVEYDDLLAVTLPFNVRQFERVMVVTAPHDHNTQRLVDSLSGCAWFATDAFKRDGADFNKGLAIEEALDTIGREPKWLCSFDADILMPAQMPLPALDPTCLYAPWRKILRNASQWCKYTTEDRWADLPRYEETWEFAGAFLLFNTGAPHLQDKPRWFGTNWRHAGGYDSDFYYTWPEERRVRMGFDVLHLGDHGQNWFGRQTKRIDDGTLPEGAAERRAKMLALHPTRELKGYGPEKLT